MKIRTEFVHPPIPDRRFDWRAIDENTYDGPIRAAYGRTELEAIEELLRLIEDRRTFIKLMDTAQ